MKKIIIALSIVFIVSATPSITAHCYLSEDRGTIDSKEKEQNLCCSPSDYLSLPPPYMPSDVLENIMARRLSVRKFRDTVISMEILSSVLWGAYGFTDDHRTLESFDRRYTVKIYILMETGVYVYIPSNHSLKLFRNGDFRWIGQYDTARVKLGVVWDKTLCTNKSVAAAEIGMIGQNVYFIANALGLGTVTTASQAQQLYFLGLSRYEEPFIVMPLGYPKEEYDLTYDPFETQLVLPRENNLSFVDAVQQKERWGFLVGSLTDREVSQILWSAYGYSYFVDNVGEKRHRTVPSSHGTYPLEVLYVNKTALYRYISARHALSKLVDGDLQEIVASSSYLWVKNADILLIGLNTSKASSSWAWYYEAGAVWHNILLESAGLNLSANVIINFNRDQLHDILGIKELDPLIIVQVGKKLGVDQENPRVTITSPEEGYLYVFGRKIASSDPTVIIGKMNVNIEISDESLLVVEYKVNNHLVAEAYTPPYTFLLPFSLLQYCCVEVIAHDYFKNQAHETIKFVKIF
jgi:nitroreductase